MANIFQIPSNSGNQIDVTKLTEHQAVLKTINSATWINLVNVTGKGCLSSAIMNILHSTSSCTTAFEMTITIDGNVVFDVCSGTGAYGSAYGNMFGIYPTANLKTYNTSPSYFIAGLGLIYNSSAIGSNDACGGSQFDSGQTYPFSSLITITRGTGNNILIPLDNPIYFNQSLLIQVRGVEPASACNAMAKVRY